MPWRFFSVDRPHIQSSEKPVRLEDKCAKQTSCCVLPLEIAENSHAKVSRAFTVNG